MTCFTVHSLSDCQTQKGKWHFQRQSNELGPACIIKHNISAIGVLRSLFFSLFDFIIPHGIRKADANVCLLNKPDFIFCVYMWGEQLKMNVPFSPVTCCYFK